MYYVLINILNYYNFIFNCIYIGFIIIFLGWNTGRNNLKNIERKLKVMFNFFITYAMKSVKSPINFFSIICQITFKM